MSRADFWCRVLGWLQIAAGLAIAAVVLFLWQLVREIFMIEDVPALSFLIWVFIVIMAVPSFLVGLLTVLFANVVEQARAGLRDQRKLLLRLMMVLTGLWAAGVIGFAGLSVPPVGFFSILALISVGLAIMGPDWTADLFESKEPSP